VGWDKVVEVEAAAAVALVGAMEVGQDEWVAQRQQGRAVTVSAPVVDIAQRTWQVCPATRKSARNAARE
jgi:hypothetical protein